MQQVLGTVLIIIVLALYALWIYFLRHREGASAKEELGVQVFDVMVKGAYSSSVLNVKAGKPVRVNFTRQESSACSRFVNFPDFKIRKELPENETVAVEFTPGRSGEFTFTCDMSMYQGKLIVE